jgi:hypothetical protein
LRRRFVAIFAVLLLLTLLDTFSSLFVSSVSILLFSLLLLRILLLLITRLLLLLLRVRSFLTLRLRSGLLVLLRRHLSFTGLRLRLLVDLVGLSVLVLLRRLIVAPELLVNG